MNSSREDYIQAIYRLTLKQGYASNKELAAYLGFSKPSVTEMVKKLRIDGIVLVDAMRITLTEKGVAIAQRMLSKHRLWEYFLSEVLHFDEELIHEQADLLEHAATDTLFEALNAYLEYPLTSPKGKEIYHNQNRSQT